MGGHVTHSRGWLAADEGGERPQGDDIGRTNANGHIADPSGWQPADQGHGRPRRQDRTANMRDDACHHGTDVHIGQSGGGLTHGSNLMLDPVQGKQKMHEQELGPNGKTNCRFPARTVLVSASHVETRLKPFLSEYESTIDVRLQGDGDVMVVLSDDGRAVTSRGRVMGAMVGPARN